MASLESGLLTTGYYYDDDVMTLFGLNRQSCCCCISIRRRIRAKVQSLRVIILAPPATAIILML